MARIRSETHDYARIYAESFGWRVIPTGAKKLPLTEHGSSDGTTDLRIIDEWWGRWPDANVAICTGEESNLVVVDLDFDKGGTPDVLLAVLGGGPGHPPAAALPPTKFVRSGGGGLHLYFRHPLDYPENNGVVPNSVGRTDDKGNAFGIADGIDIRGKGGYVVAPPSLHPSGNRYRWESPKGESLLLLPWAPLLAAIRAREGTRPQFESQVGAAPSDTEKVAAGRNVFLTTWAGALRRKGMTDAELEVALLALNTTRCEPPLPEREVRAIARSVGRYQPDEGANLMARHAEEEARAARARAAQESREARTAGRRQMAQARAEARGTATGSAGSADAVAVVVPDVLRLDEQEQHVLACVLSEGQLEPDLQAHEMQNGLLADVATLLLPEHFYHEQTRLVAEAIWTLDAEHQPVTLLTLDARLRGTEGYDGPQVATWVTRVLRTDWDPFVRDLCLAVREAAMKRKLLDLGARLQSKALAPGEAGDIAVEYSEALRALSADTMDGAEDLTLHVMKYRAQLAWWRTHQGQIQGASTGLYALDRVTSGITRGSFWIVAGRASMGKTALALTCALHNAQQNQERYEEAQALLRDGLPLPTGEDGKRRLVGLISLEMSGPSLIHRLVGMLTGYAPFDIMMSAPEVDPVQVDAAVAVIEALPLRLLDASTSVRRTNGQRGTITPDAVRRRIEAWRREGPMDLVIIDYLQLLKPNEEFRRESREQQVASISAAIKALAIDLDIGVLMLAQLNRGVEQNEGRQPQISDIRESGAVEQDADIILLLFRREYYTDKGLTVADETPAGQTPPEGVAHISIGKNRNGPTKKLIAYYRKRTMRYYDFDEPSDTVRDYWGHPVLVPERYLPGDTGTGLRVVNALPAAPASGSGSGAARRDRRAEQQADRAALWSSPPPTWPETGSEPEPEPEDRDD